MAGRGRRRRAWLALGVAAACVAACGCLGPRALEQTRLRYNESFRKTNDEQLLLNIVRLRYGDSPIFIDLPNITSQFEAASRINGVTGRDGQGPGPTDLIGADLFLRDAPTLSYHPREGHEVARALMTPLPVEALRFVRAGANIEQLFLLLLNDVNGVDNASRAVEMIPLEADSNEAFRYLIALVGSLQRRRAIEFAVDVREEAVSDPIAVSKIKGQDAVQAARDSLVFRADGGETAVLKRRKRVLTIRVRPEYRNAPELAELTRLLQVAPGLDQYDVHAKFVDDDEDESMGLPRALGDNDVVLNTRSVLQMMTFLSKGVVVPEEHARCGIAPMAREADGSWYDWTRVTEGLIRICSSRQRPRGAEVAVPYKGYWFFIPQDDPMSRATLAVLELLFSLQQTEEAGSGPLLTLPVGG